MKTTDPFELRNRGCESRPIMSIMSSFVWVAFCG